MTLAGRQHRQWQVALLATALVLSQQPSCSCSLQHGAAFVQPWSATSSRSSRRSTCRLRESLEPEIESDVAAYPTLEEQLAAMKPKPVRRRPVRRVLTINDLDQGFKGFEDEIAAQRTLQQEIGVASGADAAAHDDDVDDDTSGGPPRLVPDTEFKWYVLQVYTASELFSQKIIQTKLNDWGVGDRVRQVVVPVRKVPQTVGKRLRVKEVPLYQGYVYLEVPQTVGKRLRVKEVPLYQGYVYLEVMMDERLRDLIGGLPRVVGFVGQQRDENNVRIPDPMRAAEVERILLNMRDGDARPAVLDEFSIGDMVEITAGTYAGATGALRLVRSDEFVVRLYTFGTQIDVGMPFAAVRRLSEEEILRENAAAEAAREGAYRDAAAAAAAPPRERRDAAARREPRAYDDFSDASRLQLSPREQRRERAWKKSREGDAPRGAAAPRLGSSADFGAAPRGAPLAGGRERQAGERPPPRGGDRGQQRSGGGGLEFGERDLSFSGGAQPQRAMRFDGVADRDGAGDGRAPFRAPPPPRQQQQRRAPSGGGDFFSDLDELADAGGGGGDWDVAPRRAAAAAGGGGGAPLGADIDVDLGQDDFFAALMEELRAPAPEAEARPRRPAAAAAPQRQAAAEASLDDELMAALGGRGTGGGGGGDFGVDDMDDVPPLLPRRAAAPARSSSAPQQQRQQRSAGVDDLDALLADVEAQSPGAFDLDNFNFEDDGGGALGTGLDLRTQAPLTDDALLPPPPARRAAPAARAPPARAQAPPPPPDSAYMDELDSLLASFEQGGVGGAWGSDLDVPAPASAADQAAEAPAPVAAAPAAAAAPAKRRAVSAQAKQADAPVAAAAAPAAQAEKAAGGAGGGGAVDTAAVRGMKVPELKEQLKSRGLKVGGKKDELVERLISSMAQG